MEFSAQKTIDELGRVALPSELRQELDWDTGDTVTVYRVSNTIVIELSQKNQG